MVKLYKTQAAFRRQMEVGMDKLLEKKNLGIPATVFAVFAYLIGYYLAVSFGGYLVAVLFAVVAFGLDFDDKVKTAVKQAYIIGFIFNLIYLALDIVNELSSLTVRIHILNRIFSNLYTYARILFNIFVIIVFAVLAILTLVKKDLKINFILNIIGEGVPKQKPVQQPMYQQPQQMYQQPVPPVPPVSPQAPQHAPGTCPKCGMVNRADAAFCASCGTKLN